jgi:dihydrofolate reductase
MDAPRTKMAGTEANEMQDPTKEVSMRKVIASEFVTLEGVMEDPSWTFQFSSEEQETFKFDELAASDALLLGRVTYEGFAAAWPGMLEQYGGPAEQHSGNTPT